MSTLPNIAFCGKAGSGKTTCAENLTKYLDYQRFSFADPLKDIAERIWGWEARMDRHKLIPLGQHVRSIDPDAWSNILIRDVTTHDYKYTSAATVDDLRFPNEYWALKSVGFTIIRVECVEVERDKRLIESGKIQTEAQKQDISETALDVYPVDAILYNNDGDQEECWADLVAIIQGWIR